jgi:hypothetical protein
MVQRDPLRSLEGADLRVHQAALSNFNTDDGTGYHLYVLSKMLRHLIRLEDAGGD